MAFTISMYVGDLPSSNAKVVTIKNMCLSQPLSDQDYTVKNEFRWTAKSDDKVSSESDTGQPPISGPMHPPFAMTIAKRASGQRGSENNKLSSKQSTFGQHSHRSNSDTNVQEMNASVSPETEKPQHVPPLRSRSKSILIEQPLMLKRSSYQQHQQQETSTMAGKKLQWLIDTSELVKKDQFKEIVKNIKAQTSTDLEDDLRLHGALTHMVGYFEGLIRRLVVDNKAKFLDSEYVKALFAEEISKKREKDKILFDDSRGSPVNLI